MVTTLNISQELDLDSATKKSVEVGLVSYNTAITGDNKKQPLWLIGRDKEGSIQAGLIGVSFYNWLFVDWLWVAKPFRRQAYGSRLLFKAENIARKRGCVGVFLDTYTFQTPTFYGKHGYKEFGRLENFPVGHSRIYLRKML